MLIHRSTRVEKTLCEPKTSINGILTKKINKKLKIFLLILFTSKNNY
jgi:hypothetical protein